MFEKMMGNEEIVTGSVSERFLLSSVGNEKI